MVGRYGRGFHRRGRLGRVQRVDQHEAGAEFGAAPDGEVLQVDDVADAPGLAPTGRCTAGWRSPRPADRPSGPGRPTQAGRDDQRHRRLVAGGPGPQRVVAQRQVAGELEGGLADQPAVELPRRRSSSPAAAGPTGRRRPPGRSTPTTGSPCRTCTSTVGAQPSPDHQRRRQHPPPRRVVELAARARSAASGVDASTSSAASTLTIGLGGHLDVPALPVPELGGDAVGLGQPAERRGQIGHR